MAWLQPEFGDFGWIGARIGARSLRFRDTVFGGSTGAFPRGRFEALAKRRGADRRVRRLASRSRFPAMLHAQMSGARSLRGAVAASPGGLVRGRAGGPGGPVAARIDSGKEIAPLTKDPTAPTAEVAALYRQRWQIGPVSGWIGRNLKIEHFPGARENAARIQIPAALIACPPPRRARHAAGTALALRAIARPVAKATFQRRPLAQLPDPRQTSRQTQTNSISDSTKG